MLRQQLEELQRAPPGERFRRRHRAWRARRREPFVVTMLYAAGGTLCVLLGVVFALSPAIPGFVFVFAGVGLLSARSAWLARRLDRFELACRRWLPRRWREQR